MKIVSSSVVFPDEQFAYGEKTAYIEVAEILQFREKAEKHGFDFEIEDKYPLS